jgi:hypothetical protein
MVNNSQKSRLVNSSFPLRSGTWLSEKEPVTTSPQLAMLTARACLPRDQT